MNEKFKANELKKDVSDWMKNLEGVPSQDLAWFNELQHLFNSGILPAQMGGKAFISEFIAQLSIALPSIEDRPANAAALFALSKKHDLPVADEIKAAVGKKVKR